MLLQRLRDALFRTFPPLVVVLRDAAALLCVSAAAAAAGGCTVAAATHGCVTPQNHSQPKFSCSVF